MAKERTLVNQTIDELVAFINKKQLQEGDKLPPEAELAALLQVGRSTLREAVKILAYSNVLTVRQGAGTFVKAKSYIGNHSAKQLVSARIMLEAQAAKLLIENKPTVEQMLKLKEKLYIRNQLLQEGKYSDYVIADLNFHIQLVELANNPFLLSWYHELVPELKLFLSSQILKTTNYADNTQLHNELFEALMTGNSVKATTLINQNAQVNT